MPEERDAFAIVQALNYFEVMVFGRHIDVYSDHDPLQYVVRGAPANSKFYRWSIFLNRFDITVYHRHGYFNVNADHFTRAPMKEV